MTAYYNEIDPFAAQWLRMLIAEGHIAPGIVDERTIEDVTPADLKGFTQCHFFAGIGVWSHALRRAGWPDDRPVWTGSCPCQPYSSAGKGGGFDDERHLWPAWYHLIQYGKPAYVPVFGEQVASKAALPWLDLVQADLEAAGHAIGAVDLCAAGIGAPHIRQRLFFVAEGVANPMRGGQSRPGVVGRSCDPAAKEDREVDRVVDACGGGGLADSELQQRQEAAAGRNEASGRDEETATIARLRCDSRLADTIDPRLQGGERGGAAGTERAPGGYGAECGAVSGLADSGNSTRQQSEPRTVIGRLPEEACGDATLRPGPTNGIWRDADWLVCRDGKWRPVEPGTFPLAHGVAARVGRLRGYGNAINAEVAAAFIEAYLTPPDD